MANLIHPSALEQDEMMLTKVGNSRLAPLGTPINTNDNIYIGWNQRHNLSQLVSSRLINAYVLNPDGKKLEFVTPGITCTQEGEYTLVRTYAKKAYDNKSKLYDCLPPLWKGITWFKINDLIDLKHTDDAYLTKPRTHSVWNIITQTSTEIDITSYCRVQDCSYFTTQEKMSEGKVASYINPVRYKSYKRDENNNVQFNVQQVIDHLPWSESVMMSLGGWPLRRVPKSYLEWLVLDGSLSTGVMKTADATKYNPLRDSILNELSRRTKWITRNGNVEEEGMLYYEGNISNEQPTWPKDLKIDIGGEWKYKFVPTWYEGSLLRKQCIHLDTEESDLTSKDFSTNGYWLVDTFISCGTSTPISFAAHGPATWLEPHDGRKNGGDNLPDHIKTGLTEFDRNEKWTSAEKENYDWKPVRVSKNIDRAISHLFDLHNRLDNWSQRNDNLLRHSELEMNTKDREELNWEFKEQDLELYRITEEYMQIINLHKDNLHPSWGLKDRISKIRCVETYDVRKISELLEDFITYFQESPQRELEEAEYKIAITVKVNECRKITAEYKKEVQAYLENSRTERPAANWEEVYKIANLKGMKDSHRWAIRSAKSQTPTLNKRKLTCSR